MTTLAVIIYMMRAISEHSVKRKCYPAYRLACFARQCGPGDTLKLAIRLGRSAGWLTPHGLDQVCSFISAGRADRWHPAGPERCALMRECYKKAMPKPQMNSLPLPQAKPSR